MNLHLAEAGRTLIPRKDDEYGLLSPAMVLMTFIAGLVDALSYLALGHVFVANVTGNIVFLGFALAHAQGFVWWTSALTLVCFAFGAFIGGRIIRRFGEHRARHLLISSIVQAAFILAALIGLYLLNHYSAEPALGMGSMRVSSQPSLNFPTARHIDVHHLMLIVLIAPAMGIQNSTARRLAVPDLPTTVLTMTVTGIVADTSAHGHEMSKLGRRAVAVLAMFLGALTGAALQSKGHEDIILMVALACLLAVIGMMLAHAHSTAAWATARH
ncbi:MAG: YoaK family protein [Bifidobacterium bifidum]